MTSPLLSNAFAATGTGPWCMVPSRSITLARARWAVWQYLYHTAKMSTNRIQDLTGFNHATVLNAINHPRVPLPVRSPDQVMRDVDALVRARLRIFINLWERNPDTGRFYDSHGRDAARAQVWRIMHYDRGVSLTECAKACGMKSHSGIVTALRKLRLAEVSAP